MTYQGTDLLRACALRLRAGRGVRRVGLVCWGERPKSDVAGSLRGAGNWKVEEKILVFCAAWVGSGREKKKGKRKAEMK